MLWLSHGLPIHTFDLGLFFRMYALGSAYLHAVIFALVCCLFLIRGHVYPMPFAGAFLPCFYLLRGSYDTPLWRVRRRFFSFLFALRG